MLFSRRRKTLKRRSLRPIYTARRRARLSRASLLQCCPVAQAHWLARCLVDPRTRRTEGGGGDGEGGGGEGGGIGTAFGPFGGGGD
eukprot:scaffold76709_cov69-Phaeocystis_antarctica.AAC.1